MRVVGFKCGCGNEVHTLRHDGDLVCGDCGTVYEQQGTIGCVGSVADDETPNDELQNLIEDWKEFADVHGWDEYSNGVRDGVKSCAKELEELLNESD